MQAMAFNPEADDPPECLAPSDNGGPICERLKSVIGAQISNVSATQDEITAQINRELANLAARSPETGWDFLTPMDIQYNLLPLADLCERLQVCRHCPGLGSCKISYTVAHSAKISPPDDRWHNGHSFVTLKYGPCRIARTHMHRSKQSGNMVWDEGVMR